jgi:hypothetical protein
VRSQNTGPSTKQPSFGDAMLLENKKGNSGPAKSLKCHSFYTQSTARSAYWRVAARN